ncbi:unnamed protein product [marine sediment metagenome]|uniref:Uncharacterized protein n=1 Tax=marine sediment metagenome TaxID=412755 RepID=X0TSG0_9ZZZZ
MPIPSNKKYEKIWEEDENKIDDKSNVTLLDNVDIKEETKSSTTQSKPKTTRKKRVVKKKVEETIEIPKKEELKIEKKLEKLVINEKPIEKKVVTPIIDMSLDMIYNNFILEGTPFKISHRGNDIFNSKKNIKQDYPKFIHDGFVLFGKKYTYRGMRIEKI